MTKILPRMADKALESSGARELSVLGYCMGAPDLGVLPRLAPRVAREELRRHGGAHRLRAGRGSSASGSDTQYFDVDRFVDTLGSVPADMVKAGFKLLKPTMDLSTNLNLWWNLWNDNYVEGFKALNKWANEYVSPSRASSSASG